MGGIPFASHLRGARKKKKVVVSERKRRDSIKDLPGSEVAHGPLLATKYLSAGAGLGWFPVCEDLERTGKCRLPLSSSLYVHILNINIPIYW